MPISKLFWFAAVVTVVFLGLQVIGYSILEVIISLIIIDLIALKLGQENNKPSYGQDMTNKLDRIGEVLMDMTKFMREKSSQNPSSSNPGVASDITLGGIEKGIQQSTEKLRQEFKDDLDKIARKAIEIENALSHQKRIFSTAVASFDDRIRSVENEVIESVDEPAPDVLE